MKNFYGLILAGGTGSRLWPMSRDYHPKQFLKLVNNKTLIQNTFIRLKKVINPKNIFVLTNTVSIDQTIDQLEKYGFLKNNLIIQPAIKNTGPAMALGAYKIFNIDSNAIIINCPSDHVIYPEAKFHNLTKTAFLLANKGSIVTFGIKPTHANPNYGYITPNQRNKDTINSQDVFRVKSFVEKPNKTKASGLIKKGAYWNSGIFTWKAKSILKELEKYDKNIHDSIQSAKGYHSLKPISIDESVIEKSDLVWVVPSNIKWNDIGSWKALYEWLPKDNNSNVVNNYATALNCKRSLIYGSVNRKLTAININDAIIVDTEDSVLVSPQNSINDIKKTLDSKPQKPLVTIIVITLNDALSIEETLTSIFDQSYKNIECIIVDGGSTDKTLDIVKKYSYRIEQIIKISSNNPFEMINVGIQNANGQIIGILNPNNTYADKDVISAVLNQMEETNFDISWGDLIYVGNRKRNKISMYWKSSQYYDGSLQKGWAPPFPTFFVNRNIYEKYGLYNTELKVASDFEMFLRLLKKNKVRSTYIPRIMVKMTGKGLTWKSIRDRITGNYEFYKSFNLNDINVSPLILVHKNISKFKQFFTKTDY